MPLPRFFICCHSTNKDLELLRKSTKKSIPPYQLQDQILWGKVVSVYDGDTFTVNLWQPKLQQFFQYTARCQGYDSPEMKPAKSMENREYWIDQAYEVRNLLAEWLTGIPFYSGMEKVPHLSKVEMEKKIEDNANPLLISVYCGKWDKYGRLLVDIPFDAKRMYWSETKWGPLRANTIASALLLTGMVHPYEGGMKEEFHMN